MEIEIVASTALDARNWKGKRAPLCVDLTRDDSLLLSILPSQRLVLETTPRQVLACAIGGHSLSAGEGERKLTIAPRDLRRLSSWLSTQGALPVAPPRLRARPSTLCAR